MMRFEREVGGQTHGWWINHSNDWRVSRETKSVVASRQGRGVTGLNADTNFSGFVLVCVGGTRGAALKSFVSCFLLPSVAHSRLYFEFVSLIWVALCWIPAQEKLHIHERASSWSLITVCAEVCLKASLKSVQKIKTDYFIKYFVLYMNYMWNCKNKGLYFEVKSVSVQTELIKVHKRTIKTVCCWIIWQMLNKNLK